MNSAVTITRQRLIDALAEALKAQADASGPSPYFSRLGRNDVILDGAFDLAAVVEATLPLMAVEATKSPKAWLVRAENGNVRLWTYGPDGTRAMRSAAQWGSAATALYDHPAPSPVTGALDGVLAEVEAALPGAFWVIGRGKVTADEPMFGAQIMFGSDEVLGAGEGATAGEAVRAALSAALAAQKAEE